MACEELELTQGDDARSLHLHTLVEEYLEHSSPPVTGSPSLTDRTLLEFYQSFSDQRGNVISEQSELQALLQNGDHVQYTGLRREVFMALKKASQIAYTANKSCNCSGHEQLQGLVLQHLRGMGLNAGICKSKRSESSKSPQQNADFQRLHFPAEEYVYMDLILPKLDSNKIQQANVERVLIDLRFRSGFEIARPSPAYAQLLKLVPTCYVGSPLVLHKMVGLLSRAMKRSLESQGMPLPPWRSLPYLHSKWLAPNYARTLISSVPLPTHCPAADSNFPKKPPSSISSKKTPCSSLITARENSISNAHIHNLVHPPASPNPFLHLVAGTRVLTNFNSTLLPIRTPKNGIPHHHSSPGRVKPAAATHASEPWHTPRLIAQRSISPTKPRKLVGALTIALQRASITANGSNASIKNLHFTV